MPSCVFLYSLPLRSGFSSINSRKTSVITSEHATNPLCKSLEPSRVPGTIVQATEDGLSSELSKIRMAGITVDLWTLTRFVSKQPVKDTYGVVETPETSGLIPAAASTIDAGPTPVTGLSPVPDMSPTPGTSPTPAPEANQ